MAIGSDSRRKGRRTTQLASREDWARSAAHGATYEGARLFRTKPHHAAPAVILETAAIQTYAVRQQRRGEGVACITLKTLPVKDKILALATID